MVGIFAPQKIGPVMRHSSTIRGAADKRTPWLDLAHLRDQTTALHNVLIVGTTRSTTGESRRAGISHFKIPNLFCAITPQSDVLQTNGGHSWIQTIQKVKLLPRTTFQLEAQPALQQVEVVGRDFRTSRCRRLISVVAIAGTWERHYCQFAA